MRTLSLLVLMLAVNVLHAQNFDVAKLIAHAQGRINSDAANITMSDIGIQATITGNGESLDSREQGIVGRMSARFVIPQPPSCVQGKPQVLRGLYGAKIITYCRAPSRSFIASNICINNQRGVTCDDGYVAAMLPVNGGEVSVGKFKVSAKCEDEKCIGLMTESSTIKASGQNISDKSAKAAQDPLLKSTIAASYTKDITGTMKSFSGDGENNFIQKRVTEAQTPTDDVITGGNTHDTDKFTPGQTNNFGEAATYLNMLEEMGNTVAGNPPKVFSGSGANCEKPKHRILSKSCCSTKISKKWKLNDCGPDEYQLASVRRADRAVYVGKKCVKKRRPCPFCHKKCVKERQVYCTFPSLLAKEIQVQGRKQINDIAAGMGDQYGAHILNFKWPFQDENAHWNQISSNGISLASWAWGKDSEEDTEIFAVCTDKECGVPAYPQDGQLPESSAWHYYRLSRSYSSWHPLTSSVLVQGACDAIKCAWRIKLLGINGINSRVKSSVTWNLFGAPINQDGTFRRGFKNDSIDTAFGLSVTPYLHAPGDKVDLEAIKIKLVGSSAVKQLDIPLTISADKPYVLQQNPTILISGACSKIDGICRYDVTGDIQVAAMPWGDADHPMCQGFTPSQLMLINWDDMDLEGALPQSSPSNIDEKTKKAMQESATSDATNIDVALTDGQPLTFSKANSIQALVVSPLEGQGPFTVTATIKGQLENTVVDSVDIDWGDGYSSHVEIGGQNHKTIQHRYRATDSNRTEQIKAIFHSKQSSYEAHATVLNYDITPDKYKHRGISGVTLGNELTIDRVSNGQSSHGIAGLPRR